MVNKTMSFQYFFLNQTSCHLVTIGMWVLWSASINHLLVNQSQFYSRTKSLFRDWVWKMTGHNAETCWHGGYMPSNESTPFICKMITTCKLLINDIQHQRCIKRLGSRVHDKVQTWLSRQDKFLGWIHKLDCLVHLFLIINLHPGSKYSAGFAPSN